MIPRRQMLITRISQVALKRYGRHNTKVAMRRKTVNLTNDLSAITKVIRSQTSGHRTQKSVLIVPPTVVVFQLGSFQQAVLYHSRRVPPLLKELKSVSGSESTKALKETLGQDSNQDRKTLEVSFSEYIQRPWERLLRQMWSLSGGAAFNLDERSSIYPHGRCHFFKVKDGNTTPRSRI